jgi:hypothetical protein
VNDDTCSNGLETVQFLDENCALRGFYEHVGQDLKSSYFFVKKDLRSLSVGPIFIGDKLMGLLTLSAHQSDRRPRIAPG